MPEQVKDGDTIRVNYRGRLDSGDVFDESKADDPLEFRVGAQQVVAGFDEGVRGMTVGDRRTVEIEADDAYGPRVEQLISEVSRTGINLPGEPEAGMELVMSLPDGNQIPITITKVTATHLTLDANHPLAGERLTFDIELVEIK